MLKVHVVVGINELEISFIMGGAVNAPFFLFAIGNVGKVF